MPQTLMENLRSKSVEELEDVIADIALSISHTQLQIDQAKSAAANGEYSDPGWFNRANHALRMQRRKRQAAERLLSDRRRAIRKAEDNRFAQRFISEASRILDVQTFQEIMTQAKSK